MSIKQTLTMESLKENIREKLSESNLKSNISGTSLSKIPSKIKKILVDNLRLSTYHLNKIYFDKHLKQLMIITKPIVIDRVAIQHLMDSPEFLYIQYMNDEEHAHGLALVFKFNGTSKSTSKKEKITTDINLDYPNETEESE